MALIVGVSDVETSVPNSRDDGVRTKTICLAQLEAELCRCAAAATTGLSNFKISISNLKRLTECWRPIEAEIARSAATSRLLFH